MLKCHAFYIPRWNSSLIWPFGAIVRHGKGDLYKAEGDVNSTSHGGNKRLLNECSLVHLQNRIQAKTKTTDIFGRYCATISTESMQGCA